MSQEIDAGDTYNGDHCIYEAIAPSLITLKRLTLYLPFKGHSCDPIFSDFEIQIDMIRKSKNCVEEIFITVSSPFDDGCLSEGGYYILDRVLADEEAWTHLRHVSVTFKVTLEGCSYWGREPLSDDFLRRRFRKLTKSKSIRFTLNCLRA
ncbi:hypothetical protein CPB83DRAFT_496127 [Crepidotus variabilis]|uniref:Uncharacterized protein n=1 Tax=Crepidotus variabilis TaxID=179855 RepID=A0A9P6JN22_9AGAR|nr:hypothetical protein CPB83DRAFT_496127 [Crepidotus variabilis]